MCELARTLPDRDRDTEESGRVWEDSDRLAAALLRGEVEGRRVDADEERMPERELLDRLAAVLLDEDAERRRVDEAAVEDGRPVVRDDCDDCAVMVPGHAAS